MTTTVLGCFKIPNWIDIGYYIKRHNEYTPNIINLRVTAISRGEEQLVYYQAELLDQETTNA